MDVIAGGRLAGAVSAAGGLGFLGGGYTEDAYWFEREFAAAGNQSVGCGFITWALRQSPQILDAVVAHKPKAIFLSFDDPEPFASRIKAAGIPVFCQLQSRTDAERAIDCGTDVIVAQGTEAGGHGGIRATLYSSPRSRTSLPGELRRRCCVPPVASPMDAAWRQRSCWELTASW